MQLFRWSFCKLFATGVVASRHFFPKMEECWLSAANFVVQNWPRLYQDPAGKELLKEARMVYFGNHLSTNKHNTRCNVKRMFKIQLKMYIVIIKFDNVFVIQGILYLFKRMRISGKTFRLHSGNVKTAFAQDSDGFTVFYLMLDELKIAEVFEALYFQRASICLPHKANLPQSELFKKRVPKLQKVGIGVFNMVQWYAIDRARFEVFA